MSDTPIYDRLMTEHELQKAAQQEKESLLSMSGLYSRGTFNIETEDFESMRSTLLATLYESFALMQENAHLLFKEQAPVFNAGLYHAATIVEQILNVAEEVDHD